MLNISVIIPCFNCENTITAAVESVLEWLQHGDEVILVNDGSVDRTASILNELSVNYDKVKVFHHEKNQGGSIARNTGIKNAAHEQLFMLDSDNVTDKNSCLAVRSKMSTKPGYYGFGEIKYFDRERANGMFAHTHSNVFEKKYGIQHIAQTHIHPMSSGNLFFTKTQWLAVGGYDANVGALDSYIFCVKILATGVVLDCIPGTFYWHRHGHNSYWMRDSYSARSLLEIGVLIKTELRKFLTELPEELRLLSARDDWFEHVAKTQSFATLRFFSSSTIFYGRHRMLLAASRHIKSLLLSKYRG